MLESSHPGCRAALLQVLRLLNREIQPGLSKPESAPLTGKYESIQRNNRYISIKYYPFMYHYLRCEAKNPTLHIPKSGRSGRIVHILALLDVPAFLNIKAVNP